jgi:hypothetical protein
LKKLLQTKILDKKKYLVKKGFDKKTKKPVKTLLKKSTRENPAFYPACGKIIFSFFIIILPYRGEMCERRCWKKITQFFPRSAFLVMIFANENSVPAFINRVTNKSIPRQKTRILWVSVASSLIGPNHNAHSFKNPH